MKDGEGRVSARDTSALTWDYTKKSLLWLNVRLLWAFGVWPLSNSRLHYVTKSILSLLAVGNAIENTLGVWANLGDMEEVTYSLMNAFTIAAGVAKTCHFFLFQGRYCLLVRRVDAIVSSQRGYCESDPEMLAVTRRCRKMALRMTVAAFTYLTALCLIWALSPVVVHPGERWLPFNHFPLEPAPLPLYYELSYAVQSASSLLYIQVSFAVDFFFTVVMIIITEQLMILNARLAQLHLYSGGGKLRITATRVLRKATTEDRDDMYDELCLCIDTHQEIMRLITFLDSVMNPIVLTQFMLSVMAACLTLYQQTYSPDGNSVMKSASYLPTPGIEVFVYCWGAHNIREQGEAVSEAAYSCSWFDGSPRFKRALRMVMCRAHKPLVVTAGRLYPINRATFLSLVNASYSYFALLSRIHNR
nr:odorant receptor SameORX [Schistocerca americana]